MAIKVNEKFDGVNDRFKKIGKPRFSKGEATLVILKYVPVKKKSQDYINDQGATHTTEEFTLLTTKIKNYSLTKEELINCFLETSSSELGNTFEENNENGI